MYLMRITGKTLIKEVQEEFNKIYPSLWIEFFSIPFKGVGIFSRPYKINPEVAIINFSNKVKELSIDISKDKTVSEVKNCFRNGLGLDAQILRRSDGIWVETSLTEDWTLDRQNYEGEQIKLR